MNTIPITVDGRAIEAFEGETVIAAVRRHGIELPHFCWHAKLSVAGSCRMCLVKVEGIPKLQPACNLVATPKMAVVMDTEEVRLARKQVLQFILLNHPVDCGICDKAGECTLQDEQFRHGSPTTRSAEPKQHAPKLQALSPRISLDNERCILCSRCVRFTREVSKSNALGIVERGRHSMVERIGDQPFDDPYSDNVIGLCPTGALLSADFLYRSRVWFLEPVRSACTGCARACSIQAWRRKALRQSHQPGTPAPTAWRITAQDNPEISGPWLCNKGFDQHKAMARPRLLQAFIGGQATTPDAAAVAVQAMLQTAKNPALLLSAHASNEELDACRAALGERLRYYSRPETLPATGEPVEDSLLIRADKNPNRRGLQDRFDAPPFDAAADHDVVIVWGEFDAFDTLKPARTVHLATFGETPSPAEVVLPLSTPFERSGTFTNFEGRSSPFSAVLTKPEGAMHAVDFFARCAR